MNQQVNKHLNECRNMWLPGQVAYLRTTLLWQCMNAWMNACMNKRNKERKTKRMNKWASEWQKKSKKKQTLTQLDQRKKAALSEQLNNSPRSHLHPQQFDFLLYLGAGAFRDEAWWQFPNGENFTNTSRNYIHSRLISIIINALTVLYYKYIICYTGVFLL